MVRERARTRTLAAPRSCARSVGRLVSRERSARVDGGGRDRAAPPATAPEAVMLKALRVQIGWKALVERTLNEVVEDNCLGLAAELAYYFFLALFPALLFLVAIISFIPVSGLLDAITNTLSRVAPSEVITIVQDQILKIAHGKERRPAHAGHDWHHLGQLGGSDRDHRH